jgi:hypothetical protein
MSFRYDMTIQTAGGSCRTSEWANNEEQLTALMPADDRSK